MFILLSQVLCVHGGLSPDIRTVDQVFFFVSFRSWSLELY
jgi:diadenosine tetraphosphatase ApaH/serine/threonine PP2A family protein phosphatase